jgi:hypothetical protein
MELPRLRTGDKWPMANTIEDRISRRASVQCLRWTELFTDGARIFSSILARVPTLSVKTSCSDINSRRRSYLRHYK